MLLGFHGKLLLTLTRETRKRTTEGTLSNTLLPFVQRHCYKASTRKGEHRTQLRNDVTPAAPLQGRGRAVANLSNCFSSQVPSWVFIKKTLNRSHTTGSILRLRFWSVCLSSAT